VNAAKHLKQAEIIVSGLRKLAMPDDYLAIVDGSVTAGYHYGNALLHAEGVCGEDEHINTPSKLACAIDALPEPDRAAFIAFAELEKLRFDYVRSTSVYSEHLASAVWRHLNDMRRACGAIKQD
jgi:hypothetical protein